MAPVRSPTSSLLATMACTSLAIAIIGMACGPEKASNMSTTSSETSLDGSGGGEDDTGGECCGIGCPRPCTGTGTGYETEGYT